MTLNIVFKKIILIDREQVFIDPIETGKIDSTYPGKDKIRQIDNLHRQITNEIDPDTKKRNE